MGKQWQAFIFLGSRITADGDYSHEIKRRLYWEGLGAGGEGDDRGWDGWMASLTRCTWVWVNSGSWWWAGRPGMLQFMGHKELDVTELLNKTELSVVFIKGKERLRLNMAKYQCLYFWCERMGSLLYFFHNFYLHISDSIWLSIYLHINKQTHTDR